MLDRINWKLDSLTTFLDYKTSNFQNRRSCGSGEFLSRKWHYFATPTHTNQLRQPATMGLGWELQAPEGCTSLRWSTWKKRQRGPENVDKLGEHGASPPQTINTIINTKKDVTGIDAIKHHPNLEMIDIVRHLRPFWFNRVEQYGSFQGLSSFAYHEQS